MAAFTALNGGSPKATEGLNGSPDVSHRASSAERLNGQAVSSSDPSTGEARVAGEVSVTQRERESWGSAHGGRSPYLSTMYPDVEGSHKRKRSASDEPGRETQPPHPQAQMQPQQQSHQTPQPQHHHSHSQSHSQQSSQHPSPTERLESYGPHRPHSESRDPFGPAPREAYRGYAEEGGREGGRETGREGPDRDPWHALSSRDREREREDRSAGYEPYSAMTDDLAGDGLRRGGRERERERDRDRDDQDSDYGGQSPDGDDRSVVYQGQYTPEQRRDGIIQSDPKKRKRNFSNRTKTGCLTCRRRKKKCDELKPECNNCIRGGFMCSGYQMQKGTWPKPENKPAQINIESKDPNYVPPGAYGMPQQPPYASPAVTMSQSQNPSQNPSQGQSPSRSHSQSQQQQKREPLPYNRGQPTLRIDPPQGRPLHSDDERPTASTLPSASITTSPDHKLSALSAMSNYTNPANAFPTPVSAAGPGSGFAERTPKDYQRVPPLHDITRTEPDGQPQPKTTAAPPPPLISTSQGPTLPQISGILHPPTASTPVSAATPISATQPPSSGVQATAQLALSHTQFPLERQRNEKEEMLIGKAYYPFDKELVLERERCSAACWRFNNCTNPNLGVSPVERARLFRDILHPREGVMTTPGRPTPVTQTGRVGENVAVEAPFTCDYGYNIRIGNNVSVGRNCQINDVCEVRIGNNVVISPNVCIYAGYCSIDPRYRKGNSGPQLGKPVVVEDDVWIAANVVILPGVVIRKGSTVAAGTVVSKDVPPYSIVMGSKQSYQRGIGFA